MWGNGDVILLRPGVWHGYENCGPIEVYNCCFSTELLRRELSWTREDPLLGYLLWAGPYSAPGRGVLTRRFKAHYGLSATAYRQRFVTGAVHLHVRGESAGEAEDRKVNRAALKLLP